MHDCRTALSPAEGRNRPRRRRVALPSLVALTLGLTVTAPAAMAQPTEAEVQVATPSTGASLADASKAQKYQAKQYLDAAKKDLDRKLYDRALVKLRQSYGIVKSPGTRLRIVRALIELKRDVDAHREGVLGRAEAVAASASDPKFSPVVEQYDAALEELQPRVALVMVGVEGGAEGAALTVDGEPLAGELWAQPFAVAAGRHRVEVTRGGETLAGDVEAVVGQVQTVTLGAPADEPAEEAAPAVAPPPQLEAAEDDGGGGYDGPDRVTMGVLAGSVGVIGFVNFGIFGMLSNGQLTRLEDACPDRRCDPSLQAEADTGSTYNTVANVGLVFGVVGVAAGAGLIVWDLLDPEASEVAAGPRVTDVAFGPGSISVTGQF